MKKFGYSLAALALTIPLAFNSFAWEGGHPGKHKGPRLVKELSMTDEQKEAFHSIMNSQRKERCAIHEKYRPQIQAEMEQVHQNTVNQLTGVLTPEQLEKFNQLHEKRKERHQKHKKRMCEDKPHDSKGKRSTEGENATQ
ncbi:Spy/CpxP family protein refolding chaperone [Spartinivicinus ruber]|uniref:Spy/CpxP family protein refolding chaperone n=1 Tax=Spartinivicinus ruber TaxID=2683272 RepID=UPI0013D6C742|nr:hypothetical protein [Spartinivicinus ruber]